jgi:hypothetical protein
MEQDNKIIPAINPNPSNDPLVAKKILLDRFDGEDLPMTEETKLNAKAIFS